MSIDWFHHVEVHLLSCGFGLVFNLFLLSVMFVSTFTRWTISIFILWMLCLHSYYKRIFFHHWSLLWLVKDTVGFIFPFDLLLYLWVILFAFRLFQIHFQVVEFFRSSRHISQTNAFFFLKEIIWSSILQ